MRKLIGFLLFLATPCFAQTTQFQPGADPVSNQAYYGVAISPSNSATFAPTRGIMTNGDGAGNSCALNVVFNGKSTTVLMNGIQIGYPYPFQITAVKSTSTTCTGITVFY